MVTLCPSEVPDAPRRLRACSERLRDEEDKIAESVAAEPFSLLADQPLTAQDNRPRPARSALVLAPIGDEMEDATQTVNDLYRAWTECAKRCSEADTVEREAWIRYEEALARKETRDAAKKASA